MSESDTKAERHTLIRRLFDAYIEMYASRDDRLTATFSKNFSGYTGGGNFLVKDRGEWVKITRQDFAQVSGRLRIEMLDISMQDICDDVVIVIAFFHIHLPIGDSILSRETARLGLVFHREEHDWKIVHSGISIPYHLVRDGEIYPIAGLRERNRELEELVEARTGALEEMNRKLEGLSNTDGLTGVANRRSFDQVLAREWSRAQRSGTALALLMVDFDYFKHFNDYYGHQIGDDRLKVLAGALAKGRREGELVARYGGDEFIVLLPNSTGHDAPKAARRIQRSISSLALPHAETPAGIVTVSLGLASLVPSGQHVPEDLLRLADAALYRAKQAGRNCIRMAPVAEGAVPPWPFRDAASCLQSA